MDAFYASVELLRYPELKDQPLVIGGRVKPPQRRAGGELDCARLRHYTGRGVVTTATYEARALGVHSAMGMMKAASLAPDALLLPADFERYRDYSRRFKAAVAEIAPCIEDRGIDEIYVDLGDVPGARDTSPTDALAGARNLAWILQARVREATGLSCSVGVSPNKLLSKLASELDKPGGVTVLGAGDWQARIWPLPTRMLSGIGPKASARLASLGIQTLGELAAANPHALVREFGASYGVWLHEAAHGRDDRPVVTVREPKSISRETTFERDLHPRHDKALLSKLFTRLCEQLGTDLAHKGYVGRTIGLKLRFDNFRTVTRDLTLDVPIGDAASIRWAAGQCLKRVPLQRRLRLLGVKVGGLVRPVDARRNQTQPSQSLRLPGV